MNPVLQSALSSILRAALMVAAGWFVRKGIWTDANATEYVSAAVVAIMALVYSIYKNREHIIERVTAAAAAGLSRNDIKAQIAAGAGADPNTPAHVVPSLPVPPPS